MRRLPKSSAQKPSTAPQRRGGGSAAHFSRSAFTLVETVMVIALTAAISIVIANLIRYFYRTNAYTLEQTQAVHSARESIGHAMSDLREASYGADGSYPILEAATSSITFFADADNTGPVEKLHYYLSGTTLYRGSTNPTNGIATYGGQPEVTTLVVDNIRNDAATPLFTYFDANGDQLTDPVNVAAITSVKTTVLTDLDPNRAPLVYELSGSATLRNVRNIYGN